jgi:hypothetical protein
MNFYLFGHESEDHARTLLHVDHILGQELVQKEKTAPQNEISGFSNLFGQASEIHWKLLSLPPSHRAWMGPVVPGHGHVPKSTWSRTKVQLSTVRVSLFFCNPRDFAG